MNGDAERDGFRQKSWIPRLDLLNGAQSLEDLRSPPGNRLEALRGDWAGSHSIRINERWRLVFRWQAGDAHDIKIVDYH